ncbi:SURF1 family protein [Roseovarius sp. Pro17]|uniref:SURF1 family protein n=1 Tax=Roseovarius sp. Pro17 TaxID=3108175 RepID=UPI002D76AD36|nr:SURF1 family protein [Roseovarius sp. Pro17]
MRRLLVPLLFGLLGAGVLIALGAWQMQRLAWKEAVLADIDARLAGAPVDLPAQPDSETDKYLPVAVQGVLSSPELHVLIGTKDLGAGYRLIQRFETDGRMIMVDRGFIPLTSKASAREVGPASLIGNLHWPDEVDGYTPAPDAERGIWFARDVPAMADALGTEPVLLVVRDQLSGPGGEMTALAVDSAAIPNDHLQYAITWFSLAAIWLVMTGYLIWRMTRPGGRETEG